MGPFHVFYKTWGESIGWCWERADVNCTVGTFDSRELAAAQAARLNNKPRDEFINWLLGKHVFVGEL